MTPQDSNPARVELIFESEGTPEVGWTVTIGTSSEELNSPYTLSLDLVTDDIAAEPIRMLGQSCRLIIQRAGLVRNITGVVTSVREGTPRPHLLTTEIKIQLRHQRRCWKDLQAPRPKV